LRTTIANIIYHDLSKAKLCASVVLAWCQGDSSSLEKLKVSLQEELGKGWSLTSAMQYMAGKEAKIVLEQGTAEEQVAMLMAHQIAREVCTTYGLGAVKSLNEADIAELRALMKAKQYRL
jgi:succinylglutamate desuccinylase